MLTVFFNSDGPVIIDYLPIGMKFNRPYFINILGQISNEFYSQGRPLHTPRLVKFTMPQVKKVEIIYRIF